MRVYISGPMTGIENNNRDAFTQAAKMLMDHPWVTSVVNPAELDHAPGSTWEQYMRRDITELMTCDVIYMLLGWEKSRGALIEWELSKDLKIIVWYEGQCRYGEVCSLPECEHIGSCPHSWQMP